MIDAYVSHKKVKKTFCPNCLDILDAVTHVSSKDDVSNVDLKGHYTMCFSCTALLMFANNEGTLRTLTPEERDAVPAQLAVIHESLKEFRRK